MQIQISLFTYYKLANLWPFLPDRSLTHFFVCRISALSEGSGRYSLGSAASLPAIRPLTSVTTPLPDTNPLEGGILMEDSYPTDAYDTFPADEALVALAYGSSLPSLLEPQVRSIPEDILAAFDTQKVAFKGTLQRLKPIDRRELSGENHQQLAGRTEDGSDSGEDTGDGN
jgi:hypothetical protein